MKVIRATEDAREWLRGAHPDVPCSRCAYCGTICEDGCFCYGDLRSAPVCVPYSWHKPNKSCGFKWELKSAAYEALTRMEYMGEIHKLPPMVRDAYAILKEGMEHEREIRFHNERECAGGAS